MPPINEILPDDPDQVWSAAFWSYVHRDNAAMFNKIDMIREDLKALYSVETGETLKVFVDREELGWGQQWEETLMGGVGASVFFMPVVTANYFKSEFCRTELLTFYSYCRARGLQDLILPIVLTGKNLVSDESTDEVARIIAKSQYEDFSEVWPLERGGERWTMAILTMVRKLVAAESRVAPLLLAALEREVEPPGVTLVQRTENDVATVDDGDDDDGPGLLEVLEELEPAVVAGTNALGVAVEKFSVVSEIVSRFGQEAQDAKDDGNRYKLALIRLAESVKVPAHEFEVSAGDALDKVMYADSLIRALYSSLDNNFESNLGANFKQQFVDAIGDTSEVHDTVETLNRVIATIADAEKISVITKKALRPARRGMRFLRDAGSVFLSWQA